MKQSKPLSVVWFDRLYWLSFLIFFSDEVVKFFGLMNPEARWWLMGAVPNILIGIAIWFYASVKRSGIALITISTIAALRIFSFLWNYQVPDVFWTNPMLAFLKIAPPFLLALSLAFMMTPSATAWRKRETDYPIKIFE
jgi:hypothetical protein